VHIPCNHKKEIVLKHVFESALSMAENMLELNLDMELSDLILLWCDKVKQYSVVIIGMKYRGKNNIELITIWHGTLV
jgi:hypothetical protein